MLREELLLLQAKNDEIAYGLFFFFFFLFLFPFILSDFFSSPGFYDFEHITYAFF